ncbi:MAG TPA: type II toxin-antitoxin system VapC family toxin [Caulobacteraceae bacterium]
MPDDIVLDASVAAKLYFFEQGTEAARRLIDSGVNIEAPELLFIEMASVAAKRVRRGLTPPERAAAAVVAIRGLVVCPIPMAALADQAFAFARDHGFSAYDGAYLALAATKGLKVITADIKMVRRASEVGLSGLVRHLEQ